MKLIKSKRSEKAVEERSYLSKEKCFEVKVREYYQIKKLRRNWNISNSGKSVKSSWLYIGKIRFTKHIKVYEETSCESINSILSLFIICLPSYHSVLWIHLHLPCCLFADLYHKLSVDCFSYQNQSLFKILLDDL